jgi:ketosteroid isomerase-like protein
MDAEINKAVVRRYLEMWNSGDTAIAEEVLAPDYVDAAHPEVRGADSVKTSVGQVRAAFPGFHITIDALIGEGDTVAVRATIRRKATDSRVAWFVRLVDGKMVELLTYMDSPR